MYTSIEKNTEANMQSNPSIAQNVAIFQQIAETIGNDLAQNGLTLPDKNGHPKEIHIEIKTEPSTVWNKETQQKEPRLDRNGNQMTDYIASINRSSETLKIFAVPDREKGMRLAGMSLSKWTKNPETNKMFPKHYKVTEIADSPVSDEMKAVSSFLQRQGYIQSKQQNTPQSQWNRPQSSPMFEHTRELNQMFRERSENPENAEAFAKYASHEKYGESIRISSKDFDPDKVIELKFFRNTPSVKLTDFAHRTPDGKFQSQFLNTANDIVQNINSPLIQEAAAQFRGISPERLEQARQQNAPVVQNETIRQNTAPVQTAPVLDAPEKRIEMLAESIVQKIITGLKEEIAKNPDIAQNQEVQAAVNLVADRLENVQGIQPNVAVANEQYDIATPLKQFAIECNHSFQENMSYGMNENGEMLERPDSKAVYQNRDGNETVFLVSEGYSAVVKIAEQNGGISATAIDRAEQWNVPIDDIDILTSLVDGGNISVEVAEVTAKATGLTNEERAKYHDEYQKF